MSLSQAKPKLTAQLVCILAQQAFHNVEAQSLDANDKPEFIAFELKQLLLQALGVDGVAQTESGYFLLPQVPPSQWRREGVSGS